MTSTTLTTIPEELISHILTFLPRPARHSLCLTSRDLNRITTPTLYTHITLTGTDFSYLRSLALLIWTSPKHSALVRSLSVRRAYGGDLKPWPALQGVDLHELVGRLVVAYVKEEERVAWEKKVEAGDALCIASLLLRSLPGVDRMAFPGFELFDPKRRKEGARRGGYGFVLVGEGQCRRHEDASVP
jgi:hypothetical protein